MKTKFFTFLLVLINSSVFAQEAVKAVETVEPSAMQQALGGRPLLSSFFWGVFIVLILALAVVLRAYFGNKADA